MSTIESSKTMALIGSILLILSSVVPYGGIVVGIIGVILLLMAIKGFSVYYRDPEMYQNAVKGFIFYIIAVIAAGIAIILLAIGIFSILFAFVGIAALIAGIVVAFIFYLMAAQRLRTTLNALAQRTGERSFETAGTLLRVGAILSIIIIGFILILVAWIFAAIGFLQMKTSGQQSNQQNESTPPPPPPPTTHTTQANPFCPNCGAPIKPGSTFCSNCGKPLNQSA